MPKITLTELQAKGVSCADTYTTKQALLRSTTYAKGKERPRERQITLRSHYVRSTTGDLQECMVWEGVALKGVTS